MSAQAWGRLFWYGVWFGLLFLPFELTGLEHLAPWPTLSATLQHDIKNHPWFATAALAGCLGLTIHWMFDQRLWPSLFCGACVALNLHILNNKWPQMPGWFGPLMMVLYALLIVWAANKG